MPINTLMLVAFALIIAILILLGILLARQEVRRINNLNQRLVLAQTERQHLIQEAQKCLDAIRNTPAPTRPLPFPIRPLQIDCQINTEENHFALPDTYQQDVFYYKAMFYYYNIVADYYQAIAEQANKQFQAKQINLETDHQLQDLAKVI